MLSRSLFDCQSLTLNVMIQVSQFVNSSQLCHSIALNVFVFFVLPNYGTKSCCIKESPISILIYVARIVEKGKVCERWVVRCYFLRTFREAQVALSKGIVS